MAAFIQKESVGLVAGESPEAYAKGVEQMIEKRQVWGVERVTSHCRAVAAENTWEKRAEQVVTDWARGRGEGR